MIARWTTSSEEVETIRSGLLIQNKEPTKPVLTRTLQLVMLVMTNCLAPTQMTYSGEMMLIQIHSTVQMAQLT